MPVFTSKWSKPDSRQSVYLHVFLYGALSIVIGTALYWQPGSLSFSITPQPLAGATTLDIILAGGITYGSFMSERLQRLWADI